MPPRFVALQLSNPRGFTGYLITKLMNRRNARINAFAVQQLELHPRDRVLEIGFGGGVAIPALIANSAFVAGLDRSESVVKFANSRFSKAVEDDRAEFRAGGVGAIPYDTGTFDKVCTVNCVYFWRSLDKAFAEIFRVLTPGGRIVLGFLPKASMDHMDLPIDVFTSRTSEEVSYALLEAGFRAIRNALPHGHVSWQVIVAER